ncbi:RIP metalloprotease RseP [Methylophilaceae bacterium]|nr:RIP metalloprotease RseP [Methylophilaceae bacterium]|tara:strand:- start:30951 stop:32264 length:1314 start_codon:yes stop_codon:yes gene_type:complete
MLSFIITISLVVIVHEFGHFIVAKIFNVSIEKFSVGFGKVLYKKQFGLTEFSLRLIPLGGFVKFYEESKIKDLNLFKDISLLKRSLIVLAGPLINFIFAFLLLLFLNQGEQFKILPQITAVNSYSISEKLGFKKNDIIISINDKKISSVAEHNKTLIKLANRDLTYNLLRNNEKIVITINSSDRTDLKRKQLNKNSPNGIYFFPSSENSLEIVDVAPGSPSELSGIRKKDRIISVDNNLIYSSSDFVELINSRVNEPLNLKLVRDGALISASVTPNLNSKNNAVIGVRIKQNLENRNKYLYYFKYNSLEVIYKSFYDVIDGIKMVFNSFINIITGNIDWRLLSGPISIAELSSETLSISLIAYLSFLVFLNINIGFLNLLPIPMLDGGQLFFYMIEAALGRPLKEQNMIISQRLGVVILFLLFMLAVYNDVFNLLTS